MVSLDSPSMKNLIDKLRVEILALWPSEEACLPYALGQRPRQLADSMVGSLQTLARDQREGFLLICPGLVYYPGDQQHHELEIWRLVEQDLKLACLDDLIGVLARVLPSGLSFRLRSCQRDYLVYSRRIEVYGRKGWVRIGHCGLVNPMLLIEQGFDSARANGLALNLDLDRCLAVENEWAEVWAWRLEKTII